METRLALVGYGAMGRMVHEAAMAKGLVVASIIDPHAAEATHKNLTVGALEGANIVIDFTLPQSVPGNVDVYCAAKCSAVIGTTGWYDKMEQIKARVQGEKLSLLWASNFSLGVHLYMRAVESCAKLIAPFDEFDVWGMELHHHNKADSPSGTAKSLCKIITESVPRKKTAVFEKLDRKIEDSEFHFASVRGGEVNFEHTIGFDSAAECITIKHMARNRSGYANGALAAARWLSGQAHGFYDMDNFVEAVLKSGQAQRNG